MVYWIQGRDACLLRRLLLLLRGWGVLLSACIPFQVPGGITAGASRRLVALQRPFLPPGSHAQVQHPFALRRNKLTLQGVHQCKHLAQGRWRRVLSLFLKGQHGDLPAIRGAPWRELDAGLPPGWLHWCRVGADPSCGLLLCCCNSIVWSPEHAPCQTCCTGCAHVESAQPLMACICQAYQ